MTDAARNVSTIKGEPRAHKSVHELLESPDFKRLVSKRWSVSLVMLLLLFVSYYGYILLVGLSPATLAQKIGDVTTLGIPLGIASILAAWVLTAVYVVWANRSYDPEVERLKGQLKS
ncbi:MAG TPA: DUF485 domain-containing protein [Anaeromyxobacteraceae bacterium]|nr:DUF485 domain-containing protein [Anaeromyxobacteraceae bacterium]